MQISLIEGAAHSSPTCQTLSGHLIRIRVGPGRGYESFYGDPCSGVRWKAGALDYLPPGVPYAHSTSIETDWISVELSESEWAVLTEDQKPMVDTLQCDAGYIWAGSAELARSIRRQQSQIQASDSGGLECDTIGALIASGFIESLWESDEDRKANYSLSDIVLKRIEAFIEATLHGPVTLCSLAGIAALSTFHFTSVFRKTTGLTPYQYVLERRLYRAKRMLRHSRECITSIALDCGFSSHSHLTTTFTQKMGIAPSRYQRLIWGSF